LAALAEALAGIGRVTVMAPDRNWSASGHVKTMHKPLRVAAATLSDGRPALATSGAPSDCVALALLGIVAEKVDLVVAGINPHANLGHDVTYSGTVTAAMEATIFGVPAMAVSVEHSDAIGYGAAAAVAAQIAQRLLVEGLMPNTLLNVNVPTCTLGAIRGLRITRQGLRVYRDQLIERLDPRGRPYYWIGGDVPTGVLEPGTDFQALEDGYVSVTPLQLDLTAQQLAERIREWESG
jgi:5'-nucleotidase